MTFGHFEIVHIINVTIPVYSVKGSKKIRKDCSPDSPAPLNHALTLHQNQSKKGRKEGNNRKRGITGHLHKLFGFGRSF